MKPNINVMYNVNLTLKCYLITNTLLHVNIFSFVRRKLVRNTEESTIKNI